MLIIKQLAIFCLINFGISASLSFRNFEFAKYWKLRLCSVSNISILKTSASLSFRILNSKLRTPNSLHAYHTSLTEVNFNPKEKSLEISIRVFTDDFETALTKINGGQKIIIAANDKNDALINKYIQQHFAFFSPQKQKKNLNFIGKELEGQATWIYLEVPTNSESILGDILQNSLLTDQFDDQTNLVNLTYLANKKTFIFNAKKTSAEIAF